MFNAKDVNWGGNNNTGPNAGPNQTITQFSVFYLNDVFVAFEQVTGGPLKIRDRSTQNTVEVGGGPGADFPAGSGGIPRNQLLIVEVVQDPNGNARMWYQRSIIRQRCSSHGCK